MPTHFDLSDLAGRALDELGAVLQAVDADRVDEVCTELEQAGAVLVAGVGREGLMMRALCMRLAHLGLRTQVVGDMAAPPIGPGDLLVVSAGPGSFSTLLALTGVAREAGARVVVVTAQPDGAIPRAADLVLDLPAQTMADDRAPSAGVLPMGSLYEAALLLLLDLLVVRLQERLGQTPAEMRARHTNLE